MTLRIKEDVRKNYSVFTVQKKVRFLFWTWWGGFTTVPPDFSLSDAQKTLEMIEGWETKETKYHDGRTI